MRSQAQVHRHLRRLEIESATPPEPGTELTAAETSAGAPGKAGEVVSSAYSPALQKTVAMAYVRTPYAQSGSELRCLEAVARVRD